VRPENDGPSFEEFLRFVAAKHRATPGGFAPSERVLAAARAARRELRTLSPGDPPACGGGTLDGSCEVLEVLAASSRDSASPTELITARGFRVSLDYREATDSEPSSICVLVRCPERWLGGVQGRMAFLWNGEVRCELGEFDSDGKAIGTLPAGVEVTLNDLTTGRVRLETPAGPAHD
jgi:hypothetical protein